MRTRKLLVALLVVFSAFTASYAEQSMRGSINAGGIGKMSIGMIGKGFYTAAIVPVSRGVVGAISRALSPNPEFKLGEVYAFPNPSKVGKKPTIHIESGLADSVRIRIYDVAGDLIHEAELVSAPTLIDDGHGQEYAYEYTWNGNIASGSYICIIEARKTGKSNLRATLKFAVIR